MVAGTMGTTEAVKSRLMEGVTGTGMATGTAEERAGLREAAAAAGDSIISGVVAMEGVASTRGALRTSRDLPANRGDRPTRGVPPTRRPPHTSSLLHLTSSRGGRPADLRQSHGLQNGAHLLGLLLRAPTAASCLKRTSFSSVLLSILTHERSRCVLQPAALTLNVDEPADGDEHSKMSHAWSRWEMVDEDAEAAGMDATKRSGALPTNATAIMQSLGSPPRAFDDIPKGGCGLPDQAMSMSRPQFVQQCRHDACKSVVVA